MKTEWDYTTLADAYLKRPDYSDDAIDALIATVGVTKGDHVCDVGAGVAHLTLKLAERGLRVEAVEPNDAMRNNGANRTSACSEVRWHEGIGEKTGQKALSFDLVTFGSSFNVCDRQAALIETKRILKPKGWFACMWNHRSLNDPIQANIEKIISSHISGYGYGTRREDQSEVINNSKMFGPVVKIEAPVYHTQTIGECVEAWRSHATLERQSNGNFKEIISSIENYLISLEKDHIDIPYTTRIWLAQLRD